MDCFGQNKAMMHKVRSSELGFSEPQYLLPVVARAFLVSFGFRCAWSGRLKLWRALMHSWVVVATAAGGACVRTGWAKVRVEVLMADRHDSVSSRLGAGVLLGFIVRLIDELGQA